MSADPVDLARQAAERLQGTCQAIYHLGPEFEAVQDDRRFTDELDQLAFCCEQCNWWFEMSEMAESDEPGSPWLCVECGEDNDE